MGRVDVAVVGGGIVGLAFADAAAHRGLSVALFERSPALLGGATGASVRNFGMIWPIGQPPGEAYQRALRGRRRWLELIDTAGVHGRACGSLHLAHHADEAAVLQEFAAFAPGEGVDCEYLPATEAAARFPAVNPNGLRGVLYSPTELAIDPPQAVRQLTRFLVEEHGITARTGAAVVGVDMPHVHLATGEVVEAGRVFICTGADFETLFPTAYSAACLTRCKLQMLATGPQPTGWRLGPHVAGGLTLAHYKAFERCPSLPVLRARVAADMPEYARAGIHVMASQLSTGEVVVGDSHEYDGAISPFDRADIEVMILRYLRDRIRLPDWTVARRWSGVYAKHPTEHALFPEPQPGCVIVAGVGGAGMTLAFAVAEDWFLEQG